MVSFSGTFLKVTVQSVLKGEDSMCLQKLHALLRSSCIQYFQKKKKMFVFCFKMPQAGREKSAGLNAYYYDY